jgi:hypothetical protein
MTRGIQLKELTDTDLGHLGLAPDTLLGGLELASNLADDDSALDVDTTAVTREVREVLEAVFDILSDALPPQRA